jgi:hypothetical protein
MGRRIDVVAVIGAVIFVMEFKVGETEFSVYAIDQVFDYALDLKNFHDSSHAQFIAPVLVATKVTNATPFIATTHQNDHQNDVDQLSNVIEQVLNLLRQRYWM